MKAPLSLLAVLSICLSLVLCPAAPVRADDPLPQAPAPAQPGGPSSAEPQLPPGVSTYWWTTVQRDIQHS